MDIMETRITDPGIVTDMTGHIGIAAEGGVDIDYRDAEACGIRLQMVVQRVYERRGSWAYFGVGIVIV